MKQPANSLSPARRSVQEKSEGVENSLGPARRRTATEQDAIEPKRARTKKVEPAKHAPVEVPEEVRKKFVQIRNAYYFADGAKLSPIAAVA